MKLSGGTIECMAEGHESRREAPSGRGVWGGVPLPRDGGPGVSPPGKF